MPNTSQQLRSTLRYADFRWLVSGATVSAFGGSMAPVALAFAVLAMGGSASELGLVVAALVAAEVVTLMLGGVLGDRVRRQVMMQGSSAALAVMQALVAFLVLTDRASILLLSVAAAINGCLGALAGPSSQAMTRQTVPSTLLPSAVAMRRLGQQVAAVGGFALAGMIVAWWGPGWAIAIDACTYAVAAFCFHRLRVPDAPGVGQRLDMRGDLVEGAREVIRHTWLWLLIAQALLYHLFYGGVQGVLGPIVVSEQWDARAWGWSLAALMGGFVIGGLFSLWFRPQRLLLVGVAFLSLTGLFPLAMALTDSLAVLLVAAALHGFGLEVFSINWDLSIQQRVAEDKLARVYAFDMFGSFAARPLGLALIGPVSALTGQHTWLVVVGAVMIGSSLVASLPPSVRGLRRLPPEEDHQPATDAAAVSAS